MISFSDRYYHRLEKSNRLGLQFTQTHAEFQSFCEEVFKINKEKVNLLEIGSREGSSLYMVAEFLPYGSKIISIDLPSAGWGWNKSEVKLENACDELLAEGFNTKLILDDSHLTETKDKLLEFLDGDSLDVIFIDGDHKLKGVTNDWEMYSPLVSNGIIGIHDIKWVDNGGIQVGVFWQELKQSNYYKEKLVRDGLGIIFKG